MAAGSNWKRPWEDVTHKDKEILATSVAPSRHASVSTSQPSAPNTQYAAIARPQTQTLARETGRSSQPSTSSTYAASLLNSDIDKLEENSGYTGPLPLPYKRQRVGDGEAHTALETRPFIPPVAATQLQGTAIIPRPCNRR